MPYSNTVYVSTWAFCLRMREMSGIIWVGRHLLFLNALRRFLNGRSMLWERSCQERWKIITSLHAFITPWIFTVFVRTSDEDILMIKVRTDREIGPKNWSLPFDITKFKMFTREDKLWRLVSRCWNCTVMNWKNRQIHDPIWEGNFEFELILLQLRTKFSPISAGHQALNYFKQYCLFFFFAAAWNSRL